MFTHLCSYLAQQLGKQSIILIRDGKDINMIKGEINDSLLIFLSDLLQLKNSHYSYWSDLAEIMNQVPYAILFFFVPNLINLDPFQREEKLDKVKSQVTEIGLKVDQIGWNFSTTGESGLIIVLENPLHPDGKSVPDNFRVVAMINTFNEEDIIIPSIRNLIEEGIEVYIIDNHSTDRTYQLVEQMMGDKLIGIEKWPESNSMDIFPHESLLRRQEELSLKLEADWFIHTGTDEIRQSPWRDLNLREAIWKVDQLEYNAIDFTVINFLPVDNNYIPGTNFREYFRHFEFSQNPGAFKNVLCWKRQTTKVNLHKSGGHIVQFPGCKIFPYKFLLRHYPYRSQQHAERKIFQERKPRFDPKEIKKGWHTHYNHFKKGENFLRDKSDLIKFDSTFDVNFITERLTGIGVKHQSISEHMQETQKISRIRQLNKQNNSLKARIHNVRSQLQQLKIKIELLENQLVKKDQEILFYSQSHSWRITQPFRSLMKLLRRQTVDRGSKESQTKEMPED